MIKSVLMHRLKVHSENDKINIWPYCWIRSSALQNIWPYKDEDKLQHLISA